LGHHVFVAAQPSEREVEAFLSTYHHAPVTELELLSGGFWSSAYGYRVGGRELVARFGQLREGFEMDRAAMAFDRPGLPVPQVLDVGQAFGGAYAISARHRGRFLEDIDGADAERAAEPVGRLLTALRAAGAPPDTPCAWHPPGADPSVRTWRRWLLDGLVDDPARTVSGWRSKLALDPAVDLLFERGAARVRDLVESCPERRDLVHGDLLHGNVLLAHDLRAVTGVFSWKCSVFGDFLFDVAWCTFWSAWHPGVAALDLWALTQAAKDVSATDRADAEWRHHCYELHIGCTHLGWNAWTDNTGALHAVARHLEHVLERGPLVADRS
jgi:aminoglycoside phosphotransferase (APT) family kinase protein